MFINKKLNIQLGLMGELSLAGIVVLYGKSSDQAALATCCSCFATLNFVPAASGTFDVSCPEVDLKKTSKLGCCRA